MEIALAEPRDHETFAAVSHLLAEAAFVDTPWVFPATPGDLEAAAGHGIDGDPEHVLVGREHGTVVAHGKVAASRWDNLDAAWLGVTVHPTCRRQGRGGQMADAVVDLAGSLGRTNLGVAAWSGSPGVGFAQRRGFRQVFTRVQRRQHLPDLEPRQITKLHTGAGRIARGYDLVRITGRTPPELLDELAAVSASVNDGPLDDLEREDERFDAGRIRLLEDHWAATGRTLYRLLARHRASSELVAHTTLVVDRDRPSTATQKETTVLAGHRGHRLGLWLKSGMLLWLRDAEPQVTTVDTVSAESNHFMTAVNDMLGYRVMGRELVFQR